MLKLYNAENGEKLFTKGTCLVIVLFPLLVLVTQILRNSCQCVDSAVQASFSASVLLARSDAQTHRGRKNDSPTWKMGPSEEHMNATLISAC